jgi:hypothetical protein
MVDDHCQDDLPIPVQYKPNPHRRTMLQIEWMPDRLLYKVIHTAVRVTDDRQVDRLTFGLDNLMAIAAESGAQRFMPVDHLADRGYQRVHIHSGVQGKDAGHIERDSAGYMPVQHSSLLRRGRADRALWYHQVSPLTMGHVGRRSVVALGPNCSDPIFCLQHTRTRQMRATAGASCLATS